MVADCVEVSLERAGAFRRWFSAEKLMKIMSCLREVSADSDRSFAVKKTPVGTDDRREGRDGGHRIVEGIFLAAETEKSRCHPQRVDHCPDFGQPLFTLTARRKVNGLLHGEPYLA